MKKWIYGFFGETVGRIIISQYNWWFNQKIDLGDGVTLAIASEAVKDVEDKIQKVREAVAAQKAAVISAINSKNEILERARNTERNIQLLMDENTTQADESALELQIDLETIQVSLPILENQINTAQSILENNEIQLKDLNRQLRSMQSQQEINRVTEKVSASLQEANKNILSLGEAQQTFKQASEAIKGKQNKENALQEFNQQANGSLINRQVSELSAREKLLQLRAAKNQRTLENTTEN